MDKYTKSNYGTKYYPYAYSLRYSNGHPTTIIHTDPHSNRNADSNDHSGTPENTPKQRRELRGHLEDAPDRGTLTLS